MIGQFVLTDYLNRALAEAKYDKLEDRTFSGRIPSCKSLIAFGAILRECEPELRSTLEECDCSLLARQIRYQFPENVEPPMFFGTSTTRSA